MKCVSVLKFDSSAPFISSPTVLFRPIHPVNGLRCRCPPGFTGDYCETEIDLCYSSPCGAHGRCRSREGGYTCECQEDFTGEHCEVNARSGRCSNGVCKNGGTCVNLLIGGFHCVCPPGEFERPYCEVTTRSFPPQSFVTFRGLRQRFHFTVALAFATQERNALLLYNGRFNEKHDFIALEIVDEQVQLTFSAGKGMNHFPALGGLPRLHTEGKSSSHWTSHFVHMETSSPVPSSKAVWQFHCPGGAGLVSVAFAAWQIGVQPNIGRLGLPHGPSGEKVAVVTVDDCDTAVAVRFGSFVGNYSCAAQGTQSGSKKSLDLTGPLLLGGVPNLPEDFPVQNRQFVGCMRNLSIDGRNVDMAGFIANNGTRAVMPHPQRFSGESVVSWSDLDITISVPWYLGLMFRTRKEDGVLMEATAGVSSRLHLQILNNYIQFEVSHGPSDVVSMRLSRSRVTDGEWHHLLIELKSAKEGKDIKYLAVMTLDYGVDQDTVQIGNQLPGLRMRSLIVGGVSEDKVSVRRGFRGCMQCVDACHVNPCKHVAACVHRPDSPRGYVCECGSGHYGQYCENRIDLPCPRGWWGNPVCGPCHCAVSKGFDPDCNKTNGQCQCKENYYRPPGQDTCLPCDCFPHGSHRRACDTDTGQCSCKPGVIGRQCNRCDNPFAEVTVLGCEVLAVDVFDKLNFTGARVPRFEHLRGEVPRDLESSVFFSEDFFRPPERKDPLKLLKMSPPRLPNRPVINTPVVSAVVYSEGAPLPSPLERPVLVEHTLLETEERTKPVCVFWNHSITLGGTGGWSAKGCELLSRNRTHVACRCSHATSSAVLMDVSRREHGEVLPLKIVTYAAVSLSLAALLVAFVLLALVQTLRSNLHGIHKNLIGALFFSQLVFVIGIAQTENPYSFLGPGGEPARISQQVDLGNPGRAASPSQEDPFLCTVTAIVLHYTYMSTFAWTFVESLHVYRMLTELRNIDAGPMRFYYVVGWGIPAIVTGRRAVRQRQGPGFSTGAKPGADLPPPLQGLAVLLLHCVFNREVRKHLKGVLAGKKPYPDDSATTRATLLTRSLNCNNTYGEEPDVFRTALGESTASLDSTIR
ncbi:hypothetical protein E2I00_020147 [Balaenoptera physalus]|uniref:Cadherin EGF LAG seven-pass G-type receptor 1 n=1 Tax=Balaenoptera physalus TaxID=9770 RepID=A0A643C9H4_BALPH|nr:hypothetical protein E2I00_020147 [Balaenoptera physalus]